MKNFYDWRYILDVAMEHRRELIKANIIALFAAIASVPLPLFLPLLVDEVLLNKPGFIVETINPLFPDDWLGPVLYISVILIVTLCLRFIALMFNVWQARQFTIISKDVTYRIREGLLQRLKRISMAEYETLGSGTVTSYFVTDLDTIDRFLGSSLSRLLIATLSIIGTAAILLWMHWQLALFILFLNPVVIYFTTSIAKKVKHLKGRENKAYELFQAALTDTLDNIQQIRACNREQHYLSRLIDDARVVRDRSSAFEWKSDAANRFGFAIFMVGVDLFRALSMLMVVFSDLSIGEMMAVFGYLWFMMSPVQEILGIQYSFYSAQAALQRINSLLGLAQEPEYSLQHNPFEGKRTVSVSLQNIHFSYMDDQPILKGVSLNIEAGQKIALVGASGGGKSTLVQVLLGLYPANEGEIYFDGISVKEIGLACVRDNVATVLQQPALFNGTIRSNLMMGQDFSEAQLWQALEVSQLKGFVENLESGLDERVGRQGIRLSGGQRQRLAVARMVLSDPKVVVLDEATSALDSETETSLHQALETFLKGRTTIIIAHRLSAVKQADHVYVFEDGKICEQGQHEELINNNGLYARLYGDYQ
ncbi:MULTISPECIES: ABC transporter ATP-binding protein [unclassified Neptuniibacter]|uniref:ABC transporter ATP-binding protein n=1 Tax=unclassified Neptuniibacter TaxID=2630693 RepID=UPI0026E43BDD|nr:MULTISPECIES: ABC transporter ATP-binding protein [unclassified Neptuniibacter]MDO6513722.1 ABC transporter ATP-binding protein [Neptuniibacter sp. 2_MG-2023]MDO6593863.1 ABC transporter ATP-binding protein [Neptuniibacter sp. 1_MG-2023]